MGETTWGRQCQWGRQLLGKEPLALWGNRERLTPEKRAHRPSQAAGPWAPKGAHVGEVVAAARGWLHVPWLLAPTPSGLLGEQVLALASSPPQQSSVAGGLLGDLVQLWPWEQIDQGALKQLSVCRPAKPGERRELGSDPDRWHGAGSAGKRRVRAGCGLGS